MNQARLLVDPGICPGFGQVSPLIAGAGNLRLIAIRNGEGPEVTPRRPNRTGRLLVKASSKVDRIRLITNFISNWANAMPIQRREPPPNGRYSKGEKRRSKNRSGLNFSGSGYTSSRL